MAMENQYAKHHKNKGKLCNLIPFYRLEYRWANTTHWGTESKETQ